MTTTTPHYLGLVPPPEVNYADEGFVFVNPELLEHQASGNLFRWNEERNTWEQKSFTNNHWYYWGRIDDPLLRACIEGNGDYSYTWNECPAPVFQSSEFGGYVAISLFLFMLAGGIVNIPFALVLGGYVFFQGLVLELLRAFTKNGHAIAQAVIVVGGSAVIARHAYSYSKNHR